MTARPVTASSGSTRQIARAAVLVVSLFFVSRVTGLVREMIIGARFGTSAELDAYQAAFRVPDLLFQLAAGGALGSAFIPVFTGCLTRKDLTGGWRLFSAVINLVLILLTALSVLLALTAPWLVRTLLAPGFSAAQQALTAELVRWMLISTIIFGVSGIVMGALNSFQHFLLPALAPILYNLSIIGGAWFLAPTYGVFGLVLGVVVGAMLHLDVQLFGLWWYSADYTPTLGLKDPKVHEVARLMGPRVLGLAAVQINFWVNTLLASSLATGSLAALNYAWLLMLLPQGIVAARCCDSRISHLCLARGAGPAAGTAADNHGNSARGALPGNSGSRRPLRLAHAPGAHAARTRGIYGSIDSLDHVRARVLQHGPDRTLGRGDPGTRLLCAARHAYAGDHRHRCDGAQRAAQRDSAGSTRTRWAGARQHDRDDVGDGTAVRPTGAAGSTAWTGKVCGPPPARPRRGLPSWPSC